MSRFFQSFRMFLAAFLVTACTPSRTGVMENALTTNVKPLITITGLAPLTVQGQGKVWADAETDRLTTQQTVSFDYAIFADAVSGPVSRFGFAAIARVSQPEMWRFEPTADPAGNFAASEIQVDGIEFMVNLMRTASAKDWPSDVWRENGRDVPEIWLAKRWTAHLNDGVRAVAEYREAWPAGLKSISAQAVIPGGSEGQYLADFITRADAAFRMEKKGGTFPKGFSDKTTGLRIPRTLPDITRLVGRVSGSGNES